MARVAEDLGYVLMPHQRYVLDVALEVDPATGLPWYRDVGVSAMRQVGKSALVLPVGIHRGLASEDMGWSARPLLKLVLQNATMARGKLLNDYWPRVAASPRVKRHMLSPIKSAARPTIRFANGATWEVGGNTRDANHSQTIHCAFLDEAFAYGPDGNEEASVRPAMSTIAAAQQWTLSAGGDADSQWWNTYQDEGREIAGSGRTDTRRCYFEWGAADGVDLDDETTWPSFHPGLAYGLITLDTLRSDHERMPPGEFARAHGNRRTAATEVLFPDRHWLACAADLAPVDELQLAVDIAYAAEGHDRRTAIAVAGWHDQVPVVEVIDDRPGTSWLAERLRQLQRDHHVVGVSVDERGPVAAVHPVLRASVPSARLHFLGTRDVCGAAEQFHEAVMEHRVAHRSQAVLDVSVRGTKRRPVGDSWAYGRRQSHVDVAPLVAVSLAYRALLTRGRPLREIL